jgi:glc operon protein GlcG
MTGAPHPPGPAGIVPLAAANAAVAAVIHEATARGIGVAVVIAAPSGDQIALARMDGVPPMAAESAARKCRTVALTWKSTADFAASLRDDLGTEPEYFHGMHHVGPIMTIGGGIPILVGGNLVGIAAVSGASTEDDIAFAEVAARAAIEAMS